jgi:hypothetical protein
MSVEIPNHMNERRATVEFDVIDPPSFLIRNNDPAGKDNVSAL